MSGDENIPPEEMPANNESAAENPSAVDPVSETEQSQTKNMEVHHHTHAGHGKKNWRTYFWEFLMLFLAVFCGFLAEYQLEHKIERDREKQFINSLVEDLSQDTTMFKQVIHYLNSNVKRMDSLKYLLCSEDLKSRGSDLYYLGRTASRGAWLTLNDRTIQQMKNSGGFRLIRNEKVSKAIIEYYNQILFIERIQEVDMSESSIYREIAIGVFQPVIFDGVVDADNNILKPEGNPALLTYDKQTIIRMAGIVSYIKNSRLALAKAEHEMSTAAKKLITLLKKEYHLK